MFEDSLLESGGKMKKTSPLAMVFSVAIQVLVVIILVLIPLIYTDALPRTTLNSILVAPPPPPPPPPPPAAVQVVHQKPVSQIVNGELQAPRKIPQKIAKIVEDETPPPSAGFGVVGGVSTGGGGIGGVIGGMAQLGAPSTTNIQKAAPRVARVSGGVVAGYLQRQVKPTYPQLARTARITGDVVLHAIIGKDGSIENLTVVSGHPLLQKAALDAVREWKYKPYLLGDEAVEVDTTITVHFTLTGD